MKRTRMRIGQLFIAWSKDGKVGRKREAQRVLT
jgi:hypothetical protein